MKKTFLIFLVLLCVATMAVASVSAASDDIVSDDTDTTLALTDNTVESISSTDGDASLADESGTNDKSLEVTDTGFEDELNEENQVNAVSNLGDGEGSGNIIYVSANGSDENDGSSQAAAVATVGKAVEIANASALTDLTILVGNGNYDISKIESPAGKNISLIGESKEGTILHASGTYGINVYEDGVNWNIENFTICDLSSTTSTAAAVRFLGNGQNTINNCIIKNITAKQGAIYFNSEGTATVSNTLIEDIYGNANSGACSISIVGDGVLNLDNVDIRGCTLDDSIAGESTALYLRAIIYVNTYGATVNLMNSRITENNGPIGSIIESRAKFNIVNTNITDNVINASTNGVNGGDILIWASHDNSKINITQSVIARNTLGRSNNGVFYAQKGTTNVENSAIYDNKLANGNNATLFSGNLITAENNYWGTNSRPDTKVSQWVILTAEAPEYAFVGVGESIPVYLNTYNNTAGETGSITGMPDVTLGVVYTLNTENPATVTISNGQGAIDYTAALDGDETITLSSGDAFSFEVNADVSTLIYVDGSVATSGTGTSESPFKTIAEALNIAADGKIIVVRSGTYTESDLVIDDDITIKADKGANVIIDADSEGRVFTVTSTATLRDLSLTGGMTNGNGGAILVNGGNLTLNNVKISECGAANGGAVATTAGSALTAANCEFSENIATFGGAIYLAGEANITGSEFSGHEYSTYGGAIYVNTTSPVSISSNTFEDNDADKGEAIYIENGSPILSGNTMGDETIYVAGGSLKTILTYLGGATVNADFGETVTLTATLTSEDGNTVKGGTVTFTANGETIATIDNSGSNALQATYTVPSDASGDITISGAYSLDNAGTVVNGIVHPAVSYWFIEGAGGYETLSQAIDAASAGAVIYYDLPDDYTEVINGKTLNKAVTIKNNGTGAVTLDANKNKVFTVSANVELNNLNFINGANAMGGFISQSSSDLNIIDCTFKDSTSSSNGAAISTSYGNLNINGCTFENMTVKQGIVHYTGTSGFLNIANSVFNNITGSYDGWVISTGAPASIANSNFTNLVSTQATASSYYGAVYTTKNMNVTGCLFKDITGPKGAAIYATGALNATRNVFDNINTTISVIFASSSPSYVNYNVFVNNENAKKIFDQTSGIDANYNFWGSNEKPSTSLVSSSLYTNWSIIELSSVSETVYMGTTADIFVKFVGTDGTENLTLEGVMPEYSIELTASSGALNPATVTIADNEGVSEFTPASEGAVTITAAPGPATLELNVMDTSALLVVSTDGSNSNPGTLDSPYATIAYALSQVTDTRNIIYLLSKGEDYTENGLTVSGNVIIRGESNAVTINAQNAGRIFTVTGTLSLEDITLTGGMADDNGGAVYVNGGSLTVSNAIFRENKATNGGAIYVAGTANITNSVFISNDPDKGGAIYVAGTANIESNKFTSNNATYGGAIYVNSASDVNISSNTFEGNTADEGEAIYIENGAVSLSENTMTERETIYLAGGTVNSILIFLANSTVNADFGETVTLTATLTDDQGNKIKGGNVVFTANGETVATVANSGSAIETSYVVPSDATGDIIISGSFSLDNGGVVATGVVHPAISYWFIEGGSGYETLAQAVAAANAGDVIYGAPGTYTVNGLAINKAITIKANETGAIVLDGGASKIFTISSDVTLINLTLANGATTSSGGLITVSSGSLTANNTVFRDTIMSTSYTQGAAIYSSGKLYIYDSVFENLQARQGAAIWEQSSSDVVVIDNCVFNNLNATYDGGIIRSGSSTTIRKSNFTNIKGDTSSSNYGNIYITSGNLTISESKFINNSGPGGAIVYFTSNTGSVLNITKSLFENITTAGKGIIYSTKESYINYNAFLNVNEGINITSSYLGNGNVNYNYWGTNENISSTIKTYALDNWVIMTVTPDTLESLLSGATQAFTVDFTHYTDGTANYTLADTIPEITVSASAIKGSLDQSEIETVSGIATFTYTASQDGEETVTFTDNYVTIPVSFPVGDTYMGTIYVSKDGDDANSGSEDAPVASIEKAVALAQGKSGKIIVNEGTYVVKAVNVTEDLEITTQGDVIFDGNGTRALWIQSGDVSIENVTFTNCLEQYSGSAIRVSGGSLTIDGCTFVDNGGANARDSIINVKNAALTVNNTLFENNTASATGTSYSVIYASAATLAVDNTKFIDNKLKYGAIYATGTIAVINNTLFQGFNSVSSSGGSGCGIYAGGTSAYQYSNGTVRPGEQSIVLVENCDFINNTANGGTYYSGQGAAIYVNNNATVVVKDSSFINNTCMDNTGGDVTGKGGAIYASAGSVTVMNSVFENNVASEGSEIYMRAYGTDTTTLNFLNITNSIIKSNGTGLIAANYTNGSVVANNNWWGSNDNPEAKVNENVTLDTWVIMNVSPAYVPLTEAEDVEITIDFVHVTDAEGTITELEGTLPEEFTVKAMTMTGSLSANTVTTVDGVAKVIFTPEESGESVAFIVYEDIHANVTVNITEPYEGPIYVATNGNDENPGSPDAPVASIAKAVELAQAGTGQVIIKEGTYAENNITIASEIPISIAGEGDVVIDGTDLSSTSVFLIKTSQPISIANITFRNNKARYGGAINAVGSRSALREVDISIDNCVFDNLKGTSSSRGGAIYGEYLDGSISINNSVFTDCNSTGWGGALAITYSAYEDGLDLIINNTSFENNRGNNGGAGYLMANTITIANSNFTNNSAIYNPGALELYNCTATIDNCIFANNSAKSQGTAIKIEAVTNQPIATLNITNSIIEGNYGSEEKAPAIFVDKGTLDISYSSIVNEHNLETKTATGYDAIYGQGIAIANNNWWGTNDPTATVNGTNITIDKWVILNMEANATDVVAGDEVKVTVDFNHVNTTAGEIEELTGGVIPKEAYTVVFAAENGTVAPQTVEVPKGGFADVIFTASEPFATVTATSGAAIATLIFEGEIPEPYTGIVYVSKDGDDANNGSEDAPVATVGRAVEIATDEFGSGQIIINEGTYTGSNFVVSKDLTITGVGDVTIDGEGLGRLFNMTYGAEVGKLSLNNLVLTGAKHGYGAVVYSYAKETELNNVTIINNPGAGDLITTYGNLTIKDSTISGNDGGDVIQSSGAATIILNNTVFENNTVTASTSDYGIVYISGYNSNLIVEDCKFINNTARQGVLIGSTGTNITVKGTEFTGNNNTVAYGGVIRALAKLDVTESIFLNNNAGREGGAIYIGSSGNANITKSAFINNTCAHYDSDYNGDVISTYGKLNINYCIILPSEGSTKALIFNRNEDETPNAQYNWWGTNDNPAGLVAGDSRYDSWDGDIDCPAPDVSNWIIMNVEADIQNVEVGAQIPISVDFKHYIDANGEVKELADSLAQELTVDFVSATGTFDNGTVETVDQIATGSYTVVEGANNITVKSANAEVSFGFDAVKEVKTNIVITADNVWIGSPIVATISLLDDEGNTIEANVTVKINGQEEEILLTNGIGSYTIPAEKLNAGENVLTVVFDGLDSYVATENNASLMVLDGVVTKDTFKYYFDAENNYTLFDYVPEGATLDFQGDFIGAYTTNINKPVNIVSTTGDAFIETNKTGSFNILTGGSGTNVSGLKFLNTAFYITTAHNVTIDNINMIANMSGVGSSTGFLSIRSNSSYVTVKNSYFENGGTGSSCLVIGKSSYCTFDHNIVNATKNSGNLIYITTYVGTGDTPTYNNITNNVIESQVNSGFCYAIAVIGGYNLIENNTVNHPGAGIVQQSVWGAAPSPNGFNTYINNTLTGGCGMTVIANSTAINNTVAGAMTLQGDVTAEGNTANSLTINGANCVVKDNTINGAVTVAKAAKNTELTDNTITGLVTVNSDANTLTGNDIRTSSEYAIDLKTGAGNTVTDNTLYASEKVGDAAVNFAEDKDNTVKENYPLSTALTLVVDDAIAGESSNIQVKLVDAKGNAVNGVVKITIGEDVYNVTVTDGKGSVAIAPFAETGTYGISAVFDNEAYAPCSVETSVTVYGPGNVTVKHTDAGDAADIQAAIDAAKPGDIVQLGNYSYTDVADVNITKPVTVAGSEGTTITSAGDGTPIFNVPAISEKGPESVNITGIDFKLNNGDTVVKATADNDTSNPLSIVTPSINISGNTFETVNDDVVAESVTVLELDSERGVLSPTGKISISDNTIAAGVNPFEFEVTSVSSGGDVTVVPQNITPVRKATFIKYSDMVTNAVDYYNEGRVGEYFKWTLVDAQGKPIANKPMQIGFNGVIYKMTTDKNGKAQLQINLGYKGDYTFAITFLGDDNYNASFVVAKIKVNPQKPTLTVPNKSYKASAKTKTLTATFKSVKGKLIAKKKVTFTVNGKTYTAKTNAKGVATVKVSLNKKGTYNFTAKFAGDSTYAAVTKTAKLTLK